MMEERTWFVHADGQVLGPSSKAEVVGGIHLGRIAAGARVRQDGDTDWRDIREVAEFAAALDVVSPASASPAGTTGPTPSPSEGRARGVAGPSQNLRSSAGRATPTASEPASESTSKSLMPKLLIAGALLLLLACGVGTAAVGLIWSFGGSAASTVSELVEETGTPLLPSVADVPHVRPYFGTYSRIQEGGFGNSGSPYFEVRLTPTEIRCNHSNHSDDWHQHRYGVARVDEDEILLVAEGGSLTIHRDSETGNYNIDAAGICPWGIDNPYSLSPDPGTGEPWFLLDPEVTDRRGHQEGELGTPVELRRGSLTLRDVRRGRWTSDDETVDVLELRFDVSNTSDGPIDLYLPNRLAEQISNDGWLSVECGPDAEPARGEGNPANRNHRQPPLDHGVYTIWGGHTDLTIPAGRRRSGWVTMLLRDRAESPCAIHVDALGLGGGIIDYNYSFPE